MAAACLTGYTAYADTGLYSGAHVGANYLQDEQATGLKNGYKGGLCVGYKFNNGMRVEAEIARRKHNLAASSMFSLDSVFTTDSFMANVFYDIDFAEELNTP